MKEMHKILTFGGMFVLLSACAVKVPPHLQDRPLVPYDPPELPYVEPYNPESPQFALPSEVSIEPTSVEVYNIDVLLQKFRHALTGSGAQVISKNHHAQIIFPSSIAFGSNRDTLKADFKKTLKPLVDTLKAYRDSMIYVVGYTDDTFSVLKSKAISESQAQTFADYLVSEGIEPNRLLAEGKGREDPIANNQTKEGRLQNNRVEMIVIGLQ